MDEEQKVAPVQRRGRGSTVNMSGRFERFQRSAFDDGWGHSSDLDRESNADLGGEPDAGLTEPSDALPPLPPLPPLRTEVHKDSARTILTRNDSPDIPFERSLNPYRGCEHGCIYCYARPSHAYLGLSPGLDFESQIWVKPNAPALLAKAFSAARYQPTTLLMGSNTDPYQPIERHQRITRALLDVLRAHRHPVSLITKGALVVRDIDILADLASLGLVKVALSLTTLDTKLARRMEPRASSPRRRLWAIEQLSQAGIPTQVLTAPLIPKLNDMELEDLLKAAAEAGACEARYTTLRLPYELRDLFVDWLETHYPERAQRVMRQVRDLHGGKDYSADWGKRMRGQGHYAELIKQRFRAACKRYGLNQEPPITLRHDRFRRTRESPEQLSFDDLLQAPL